MRARTRRAHRVSTCPREGGERGGYHDNACHGYLTLTSHLSKAGTERYAGFWRTRRHFKKDDTPSWVISHHPCVATPNLFVNGHDRVASSTARDFRSPRKRLTSTAPHTNHTVQQYQAVHRRVCYAWGDHLLCTPDAMYHRCGQDI